MTDTTRRPEAAAPVAPPRAGHRPSERAPATRCPAPARTSTCATSRRSRSGTTTCSTTRRRTRARCRGPTCWCRRRASTASRRAACWPTSTRRTSPSGSWRATPPTPARAGATAPRARPRSTSSTTPSGSCTRCAAPVSAAAGSGSRSAGTTPSTTSPAASGRPSSTAAHEEVMYHVGRPGRGRLRRAVPAGLGRGRAQQPHQRLLGRRPARPDAVGRLRPALPRPRQRQGHPAAVQPPGDRPLLQPARPADPGGQAGRGQAGRRRPADVEHRQPRRRLAGAVAGQRGGDPARRRLLPAAHPADRRAVPAPLVQLADLPARSGTPTPRPRSRRSSTGSRPTTRATPSSSPRRRRRCPRRRSRRSRSWSPAATTGWPRTSGGRRPPATSAAGRWRARCGSCWR